MTEIFDDLYSKSQAGYRLKNVMSIITSPDNILSFPTLPRTLKPFL